MYPGAKIKRLLKIKNMTQRELADLVGLKEQHLSKMLNGTIQTIPTDLLTQIGHILQVDPAYFLGWRHEDYSPDYTGVAIPVYSTLTETLPDEGMEYFVTTESISRQEALLGKYFGVIANENAPALNIVKGDTVIIRKQNTAKPDDIVAALSIQNSKEQKKIARYSALINQRNSSIWKQDQPSRDADGDESADTVKIIGKCVEIRRKL